MPDRPYVKRLEPWSDQELEQRATQIDQRRASVADRWAAGEVERRNQLLAGPALVDLEAAVNCQCGCHPRPANTALHDGGSSCPCQWTLKERDERKAAARDRLRAAFDALEVDREAHQKDIDRQVAARAAELGVEISQAGGMAPLVVTGMVDGRAFFLRERHDLWRVEIAPDHAPGEDPWTADPATPSIVVARGTSVDLWGGQRPVEVEALELAVDAVRTFLLRRACAHPQAGRFCPDCGVEMARADEWRISTDVQAG